MSIFFGEFVLVFHVSPFAWCWVEEECGLDDGGDGVGDEGEEEGKVCGRP